MLINLFIWCWVLNPEPCACRACVPACSYAPGCLTCHFLSDASLADFRTWELSRPHSCLLKALLLFPQEVTLWHLVLLEPVFGGQGLASFGFVLLNIFICLSELQWPNICSWRSLSLVSFHGPCCGLGVLSGESSVQVADQCVGIWEQSQ